MMLSTTVNGIKFGNPLLPGSGPLTGNTERLLSVENTGVGALVTKTIAPEAAQVARPCIVKKDNVVMNCEAWSEYPSDFWIEEVLPKVRARTEKPIIASVGYSSEDYQRIVPKIDHLVQGYECLARFHSNSGDYSDVGECVRSFRSLTDKPIWVKMGALKPDPVGFARTCLEAGAQGVVAITSLGPCLAVDISTRKPLIGLSSGYSWASGPAIKPLALSTIFTIRNALPNISIIGSGGIANAEDVLEFLLAGADVVEMLSTAMLKGIKTYTRIIEELPKALRKFHFSSIDQVKSEGLSISEISLNPRHPLINLELCTGCGACVRSCPYTAMDLLEGKAIVNREECFGCGFCETICPTGAIAGVLRRD